MKATRKLQDKASNAACQRRFRSLHRRIDYKPLPDTSTMIDEWLAHQRTIEPETTVSMLIDALVRLGNKSLGG